MWNIKICENVVKYRKISKKKNGEKERIEIKLLKILNFPKKKM